MESVAAEVVQKSAEYSNYIKLSINLAVYVPYTLSKATMASVKQANAIKGEHRAAIDEMMKEATKIMIAAPAAGNANEHRQATTKGAMRNDIPGPIAFTDKKDWSGSVLGSYPPKVEKSRSGTFSHRGTPPKDPKGSKGAVVYYGPNVQGGPPNCAWVLAWNTPGDGTPNQIYVEAGPISKYPKGSIHWDTIQASLDASSNESYYKDDDTGAEASANISSGNVSNVAAVFDVSL